MDILLQILPSEIIEELQEKFESEMFSKINDLNLYNNIKFLQESGIDFIDDIIEDYLDILVMDNKDFINKFNKLKNKLLEKSDLNVLEAMYE